MCVRLLGAVSWHANVLAKLDAIQGHVQANEGRANGDFPPDALKSEIDKHPQYMAERSGAKHKLSLWNYWWVCKDSLATEDNILAWESLVKPVSVALVAATLRLMAVPQSHENRHPGSEPLPALLPSSNDTAHHP
jgi:hypothetical protein